jgi:secretion/DNA translocation related CpaE-like protein
MSAFAAVPTGATRPAAARSDRILAVVGGCGGAGASTLAAALAITALTQGRRVALLDADPLGAGLDTMLDRSTSREPPTGPRPDPPRPNPPSAAGCPDPPPTPDLALISWGQGDGREIPVGAMRKALRIVRGTADLIIVDLPRTIDPTAQLVLAQATHSLLILPAGHRPVLAAGRLLPRVLETGARPGLVVRLPKRDGLAPRELSALLGLSLTGVVKPQTHPDDLRGATPLGRFADRYLARTVFGSSDRPERSRERVAS